MKYFPYNAELESQINEIKTTIRLSMNGVSSDAMKLAGVDYKQNFGLSLPRIKEISQNYTPNTILAQQLWALKIRETMILATLLHPKDTFNAELADEWIATINTTELCEQCSFNLFQFLSFIPQKVLNWIESDNRYAQITALLVASRICNKFTEDEKEKILMRIIQLSTTNEFSLYHSISVCLRYFCKIKKEYATQILFIIHNFKDSNHISQQYIFQEVNSEVTYLL